MYKADLSSTTGGVGNINHTTEEIFQAYLSMGFITEDAMKLVEASQWYDPMAKITCKEATEYLSKVIEKHNQI